MEYTQHEHDNASQATLTHSPLPSAQVDDEQLASIASCLPVSFPAMEGLDADKMSQAKLLLDAASSAPSGSLPHATAAGTAHARPVQEPLSPSCLHWTGPPAEGAAGNALRETCALDAALGMLEDRQPLPLPLLLPLLLPLWVYATAGVQLCSCSRPNVCCMP
jgi:hypothetical protein